MRALPAIRPARPALRSLAGAAALPPIPFGLSTEDLAALVGLRRRHARRHGLPLHGSSFLGAESSAPHPSSRRRSLAPSRDRRSLADRALRVSSPRATAGRPVDLVRQRQASRSLCGWEAAQVG